MSRLTIVVLTVGTTAAAASCGSSYAEDTRAPDDGGTRSDGAPPKCGDPGSQCVVVPAGWLVVAPRGEPDPCPAYYTDPRVVVGEPSVGSDTCECTCGAPTTLSCTTGVVELQLDGNGSVCGDNQRSLLADGATCRALPSWNPAYTGAQGTALRPAEVPCEATAKPPALTFAERLGLCTSPPPTPCPDGTCVAVARDQLVCVLRDGEHECPAGYAARKLYTPLGAIADKRSCAPCACTGKAPVCSNPKLMLFNDSACTVDGVEVTLNGVCNQNASLARTHFKYTALDLAFACTTTSAPSKVVGTVENGAKQTLCCASE